MSSTAADLVVPPTGSYEIDTDASSIEFDTKHFFGLGTVHGSFSLREGEVTVGSPIAGSTVTAVADVASFHSAHPKRDAHVRSAKFLDAENHPTLTFRSSGIESTDGKLQLSGALVVKGKTSPLDLTVTEFSHEADGFTATAQAKVDRYQHHIVTAKGLAGRWLTVKVKIAARIAAEA